MNILHKAIKFIAKSNLLIYLSDIVVGDVLMRIMIPTAVSGIYFTALTLGLFGITLTEAVQRVTPYVMEMYLGTYVGIVIGTFLLTSVALLSQSIDFEEEETDHEDHSN
jgi:hypothetical protein